VLPRCDDVCLSNFVSTYHQFRFLNFFSVRVQVFSLVSDVRDSIQLHQRMWLLLQGADDAHDIAVNGTTSGQPQHNQHQAQSSLRQPNRYLADCYLQQESGVALMLAQMGTITDSHNF
jgi:hypothetical protein